MKYIYNVVLLIISLFLLASCRDSALDMPRSSDVVAAGSSSHTFDTSRAGQAHSNTSEQPQDLPAEKPLIFTSDLDGVVIRCRNDAFDNDRWNTLQSESKFYEDYKMFAHPDMLPTSEHEKQLLLRLGDEAENHRQTILEDIRQKTNPYLDYERLKEYDVNLISYIYADIDRDGISELFAELTYPLNCYLWHVDDTSATILEIHMSSYTVDKPMLIEIQNHRFVVFKGYQAVSSTRDVMYGLQDGVPYSTNISGNMIDGTSSYDDVLIIQTTYDAGLDGTGRTWKPYYFHLREDGIFREYGGIEITLEDVYAIDGAKEIVDEILADDIEISSIYYRANGIVNINYIDESRFRNKYITLRCIEDRAVLEDAAYGIYLAAYLPDLADYPKEIG